MSNYTKTTNFAVKDALASGDPAKVVKGTEIDTEFNNIATASATKTDNSAAAITGGTINGTTIGGSAPAAGTFTTLTVGTGIAGLGTITKRKTADESVTSSTTLQDDDHLLFSIAANEEWTVFFEIAAGDAISTTGAKVSVTSPAGSTITSWASIIGAGAGQISSAGLVTASGSSIFAFTPAAGTGSHIRVAACVLNGATPGSVTLQWAQNASSGTALTFHRGSFMQATRVA